MYVCKEWRECILGLCGRKRRCLCIIFVLSCHMTQSQDNPLHLPDSCGSDVMMVMKRVQDEDYRCFMTPGQSREGYMYTQK